MITTNPLYTLWRGMLGRCNNPKSSGYEDYGERGIKVCTRWNNLDLFCKDIGPRPSKDHSVDRINNDGNYEPSNCRWATRKEQAQNKRLTRRVQNLDLNGYMGLLRTLRGLPKRERQRKLTIGLALQLLSQKKIKSDSSESSLKKSR